MPIDNERSSVATLLTFAAIVFVGYLNVGRSDRSLRVDDAAPIASPPTTVSATADTAGAVQPLSVSPAVTHTIYLPVIRRTGLGPQVNLIANSTFESGNLNGWDASGATVSTTEAHGGIRSARLTNGNLRTSIPTIPGITYKVTAWIKIVSETGSDWGGFRIEAYGQNWNPIAHTGWLLTQSQGSEWLKIAISFTAELDQTTIDVGYFGGAGRTMVVHVDDIIAFPKGDNVPPDFTIALSPTAIGGLPQTQTFSLMGDDADGAIARVLWDFGDGTRALSSSGTRSARLPGRYTATVTVSDDEGAIVVKTIDWTAAASGFPDLTIDVPAEYTSTVASSNLAMSGTANGAGVQVQVSTDRGYAGAASGATAWSASVPLQPGFNRILVQARSTDGHIATAERLVHYVPGGSLGVSNLQNPTSVDRWEPIEIAFNLDNSAATQPQFPYDPTPPPGLAWVDGVTVDGLFTPDNWHTVYRRPALLLQRYQRALKDGEEWMYPQGDPVWVVRFAPPAIGAWQYRIEVSEAKGAAQSIARSFNVTAPANSNNHGPIRVAALDSRYFELADGTPFLGTGHGISFSHERFSYDAVDIFNTIGAGNQQFFRWWIAGQIWGSAWYPWSSRTLSYDGTVPATGLTVDRAYGDGLASLKLDAANPIMFQGFQSGHAGLIPGHTYRVRVRWRTEGVTGPATAGRPYGATVKFTGWPEPGQTGSIPAVIPHVNGDTPWHVDEATFGAQGNLLPNLTLILENTTAGAAYVDEIGVYEILSGGGLGPQLLRSPRFNAHTLFDPRRGAGMDAILTEANARGLYFKVNISEKQEYLLNHFGPDGLPDKNSGNFNGKEGSPARRLHEYYWRYLFARFGAFRAIHSWELVNEEAPGFGDHFRLAVALAKQAAADGDPHLATTSTWATLAEDAWKNPESAPIGYTDFHAYVRGTGWIEPKDELTNDSARFFHEYDLAARAAGFNKPVVWGEQGIDGTQGTDGQDPLLANDQNGVWLHKITWARSGPGGVYPLYWYTNHIFGKSLHPIFGAWNRFMTGIPFTNGRYVDVAATSSNPDIRIFGQKDVQAGNAYVWIDNKQDTWRAVVDGTVIPAESGTVSIDLQTGGALYAVTWYNTQTGQPTSTQAVSANGAGVIVLNVSGLSTDVAARITRQ